MPTVYEMRKKGFRVVIFHNRPSMFDNDGNEMGLCARGGFTRVELYTKENKTTPNYLLAPESLVGEGEAFCHLKDNYNRKLGVKIALGRAISDAIKHYSEEILYA